MSVRVLVVGGAGYVGSHTAKALHPAGYTLVVFDNLSMGYRWAVKVCPTPANPSAGQGPRARGGGRALLECSMGWLERVRRMKRAVQ
jgi:nucleoside-diphosphate-sugar epimerase